MCTINSKPGSICACFRWMGLTPAGFQEAFRVDCRCHGLFYLARGPYSGPITIQSNVMEWCVDHLKGDLIENAQVQMPCSIPSCRGPPRLAARHNGGGYWPSMWHQIKGIFERGVTVTGTLNCGGRITLMHSCCWYTRLIHKTGALTVEQGVRPPRLFVRSLLQGQILRISTPQVSRIRIRLGYMNLKFHW